MNIRHVLSPPKFSDEEDIRIANILNSILLSLLFSGTIYGLVALVESPFQIVRFVMVLFLIVLTLLSYVFMKGGRLKVSSIILSVSALLFTTSAVIITGGVEAPMTAGFIITFLVAGVLLGWQTGIIFAALSFLAWTGVFILEVNGLLPDSQVEHQTAYVWGLKNLLFFVAAVILYLATKSISNTLQLVRTERDTLEEKVDYRTSELKSANENLKKKQEELHKIAITDELTRLFNRRYFNERMHKEFSRSKRHSREFSFIICDIDHFKIFNDTHGHQTGDLVLQRVASLISKQARESDVVARYGGEEFVILLPETGISGSKVFAEKMRIAIEKDELEGPKKEKLKITISSGICVVTAKELEHLTDYAEIVKNADDALYRAKENGRNRIELHSA